MKNLKLTELTDNLQEKLDMVAESDEVYKISTGKGNVGVVLMSLQEYNSWKETEYLLNSKANRTRILESLEQVERGEFKVYRPEVH